MATLQISDELLGKGKTTAMSLECLSETMTVREVIRERVYQEVTDYNQASADEPPRKLLVTPSPTESFLNETPSKINSAKKRKQVNWETQFKLACEAFESNGFFVLIGDHQAESLDEKFTVQADHEITFVKLVPLVGG